MVSVVQVRSTLELRDVLRELQGKYLVQDWHKTELSNLLKELAKSDNQFYNLYEICIFELSLANTTNLTLDKVFSIKTQDQSTSASAYPTTTGASSSTAATIPESVKDQEQLQKEKEETRSEQEARGTPPPSPDATAHTAKIPIEADQKKEKTAKTTLFQQPSIEVLFVKASERRQQQRQKKEPLSPQSPVKIEQICSPSAAITKLQKLIFTDENVNKLGTTAQVS
ncbi:hypothetical protein Tco_0366062 [Tanacetum coccineum]